MSILQKWRRKSLAFSFASAEQWAILTLAACLAVCSAYRFRLAQSGSYALQKGAQRPLRIDLNRARWSDLLIVPGIGPRRAREIVALREQLPSGRYTSFEQLQKLKGVTSDWLKHVEQYITIANEEGSR